MNNKAEILSLQNRYIETHDSKALALLYDRLIGLCVVISSNKSGRIDHDDCVDIASDIVMRLVGENQVIIKSAPSSFLSHAMNNRISVKNRERKHPIVKFEEMEEIFTDSADAFRYCQDQDMETEDPTLFEEQYDKLVEEVLSKVEIPEGIRAAVEQCLYNRLGMTDVRKTLPSKSMKMKFTKTMKEVEAYVDNKNL